MPTPANIKITIKKQILAILSRDKQAEINILSASLALEHGWTEKTIMKIFELMERIGVITIDGNIIKLKQTQEAVPNDEEV